MVLNFSYILIQQELYFPMESLKKEVEDFLI
jgi:hypothetical protein